MKCCWDLCGPLLGLLLPQIPGDIPTYSSPCIRMADTCHTGLCSPFHRLFVMAIDNSWSCFSLSPDTALRNLADATHQAVVSSSSVLGVMKPFRCLLYAIVIYSHVHTLNSVRTGTLSCSLLSSQQLPQCPARRRSELRKCSWNERLTVCLSSSGL